MTLLVQGQLGMKAGNKLRFEILTIGELRFCFSFAIYVGEERGSKKTGTNWEKSLTNRRDALEEEEAWFYVMNGMGFFHGSSLQFKARHVKRTRLFWVWAWRLCLQALWSLISAPKWGLGDELEMDILKALKDLWKGRGNREDSGQT